MVLMQACDGEANPDIDAAGERLVEAGVEVEPGSEPARCPWSIDALFAGGRRGAIRRPQLRESLQT
jgi:hypothetical protein